MNDDPSDGISPTDLRLRRLYEAVATEQTSASLDAAVLSEARQALKSRTTRRWTQPLAMAASTVLCVGLAYQLVSEPERGDSIVYPAESSSTAVHKAAVESRARKLGGPQREKAGAAAAPFDDGIPDALPDPDVRTDEPTSCSPELRLDPADWLSCIQALESMGQTEQATVERASLLRQYPAIDTGAE